MDLNKKGAIQGAEGGSRQAVSSWLNSLPHGSWNRAVSSLTEESREGLHSEAFKRVEIQSILNTCIHVQGPASC